MKYANFEAYLRHMTERAHPSYLHGEDPRVELVDDDVRIFDQRGESLTLRSSLVLSPDRILRVIAYQLELVANEIERRRFDIAREAALRNRW